jgi:hypothetical protein
MLRACFLTLLFVALAAAAENMFDKEKIKEGKCAEEKEAKSLDKSWVRHKRLYSYSEHNFNNTFFSLQYMKQNKKGWHYVMSSRHHASAIKDSLTGKPPKDMESFDGACVNFVEYDYDKNFRITGWGNKADYEHVSVAKGQKKEWVPTEDSTNVLWAAKRGACVRKF